MGLLGSWLESLDYDYNVLDSCVRKKSRKATCTSCIESCPDDAIELKNGEPVINSDKCTACGCCMVACPVQAIEGIFPKKAIAGNQLAAENEKPLTVTELLIIHARGVTTILSQEKEIDLEWNDNIQEANAILAQLGKPPFLVTDSVLTAEEETAYTRRELFSLWGKESKSTVANITPAKWRFNHSSLELAKYYPDHQFFDVSVDEEKCTLCKICSSLCPKGCFSLEETEFAISSQACSNCGLCVDTCPEGAVMIEARIAEASKETHQAIRKTCPDCKQSYLTFNEGDGKCRVCANRRGDFLRSKV
ncbi:4Fe-4S binding protein [Bacillus marinisedimentorum]|uniref:4Fe-4S binding protein n=1 Tax=Bacillus marinisedimentorum TaxID=1821260 RepID=UPI0008722CDD|nr:4Fe-4S binding protein [Bacillus marinisedimentorum]